jgi:phosphatidylglycerol phospholipase C
MVWTVNDPLQMIEAVRWNVAVIITDKPKDWVELRNKLSGKAQIRWRNSAILSSATDNTESSAKYGRGFLWTSLFYYRPTHLIFGYFVKKRLEKAAGPFLKAVLNNQPSIIVSAAA